MIFKHLVEVIVAFVYVEFETRIQSIFVICELRVDIALSKEVHNGVSWTNVELFVRN